MHLLSNLPSKTDVVAWLFHCTGINRLFCFLNRNRKRILTYHNILPDDLYSRKPVDGVSHQQSVFESHLAYITSRFRVGTDLDNLQELTITFDDGYLSQYTIGQPCLARRKVPAIFFCTLDLLQHRQEPLLVDSLLFWLSYVDAGAYEFRWPGSAAPMRLDLRTDADRSRSWSQVYARLAENFSAVAPLVQAEFERCVPFAQVRKNASATYYALRCTAIPVNGIADLKAAGHLIGAHAKTHAPLTALDDAALDLETASCATERGGLFNTAIFSYPFGGLREVGNREILQVEKRGFSHGVANTDSPLPQGRRYSRYFIPRMALPNTSCRATIAFILSGAKYFLQHRRLLPSW